MTPRPAVLLAFGTRPEAIKLAPVALALRREAGMDATLLSTGQHADLVGPALEPFGLEPDIALDVMRAGQDLTDLAARVATGVRDVLEQARPDLLLVQGDTTTTFAAALAAFHAGVAVGHVEAGLRTGDLRAPFPEEANRRLVSVLADMHFAPTARAAANLRAEGVSEERIHVTGNTVVDALRHVASLSFDRRGTPLEGLDDEQPLVVVTAHRRENHGPPLEALCRALADVLEQRPECQVVFPVHPSPSVRQVVLRHLSGTRVRLLPPLDHVTFVQLMSRATLVLTDSGGVQEEAPALGVPVLVFRETTERPEGVEAGCARLVGTQREAIARAVIGLLDNPRQLEPPRVNPYGDGRAAVRIAALCREHLEARAGRRALRAEGGAP